jgi:hypothetical protein
MNNNIYISLLAVKRFDPEGNTGVGAWCAANEEGDYVLYSDYAALFARLAEVEAERDKALLNFDDNYKDRGTVFMAITRAEAAEAKLERAYIAGLEAAEERLQKTEDIIGSILNKLDDALSPSEGCISMHAQGQTPDWFVEAAYEACFLRENIRALKDLAHVKDAVAKLTEGER